MLLSSLGKEKYSDRENFRQSGYATISRQWKPVDSVAPRPQTTADAFDSFAGCSSD
jgi:hypothetical protein